MQITISQQKNNNLLDRVEITGTATFDKETPSNSTIAEAISKELKKDIGLVVPKHIYTKFGLQEAAFSAFVYGSAEARSKSERMTKHLRKSAEAAAKKLAEEKQATEEAKAKEAEEKAAAKAEVKEEAPKVEEKAEEPKEEVKA